MQGDKGPSSWVTATTATAQPLLGRFLWPWVLLTAFVCLWSLDGFKRLYIPRYAVCSMSGNIYTVDGDNPRAQCLLVKGSTIQRVGSFESVQQYTKSSYPLFDNLLGYINKDTKIYHLDERAIVVPGLSDAHAHVLEYGYMLQLPLAEATSIEDVVNRIKNYIISHSDVRDNTTIWIEGMGWDQTKWPISKFPTAADLDQDPLLKGRPISLSRVDGHARWVSPRVLELMGDLPDTVEGGQIVRDEDGKPTGVFVDNAMNFIPTPPWSDALRAEFFDTTMKAALSVGLTLIHDADSGPADIAFFKKKAEEGSLPIRLYLMGHVPSTEYWGSKLTRMVNYGKHGHLTVRSVKLFADGALGSWGAALLEPYSDRPETSGIIITPEKEMSELVHRFFKDGWQVNVHCIGDRANHMLLDIFEDVLRSNNNASVEEWRPRIEHAQIFAPDDIERIGKLGVIASVQPTHATSDMSYAESRLGPERIKGAYAYRTLLRNSPVNVLPLGSDFPVEGINPLLGFYAAVARLHPDGTSPHGPGGWYPAERLTRVQALKGMTLDAAYASFRETEIGSLKRGKKADFVVLDRDIMTVPFDQILDTRVRATVIDGEVAYGSLT